MRLPQLCGSVTDRASLLECTLHHEVESSRPGCEMGRRLAVRHQWIPDKDDTELPQAWFKRAEHALMVIEKGDPPQRTRFELCELPLDGTPDRELAS